MGQYNTFIVKIWTGAVVGKIRGRIQHVGSQEAKYFVSLEKMVEFIIDHIYPSMEYLKKTGTDYFDGPSDEGPGE